MAGLLIGGGSGGGGGSSGHVIKDEGSALAARANIDFVGAGVTATDDAGANRTVVTIPGGGWTTLYNVDFTSLASVDLLTTLGAKTIDGKAWTLSNYNSAVPAECKLVNGSGLRLYRQGGSTTNYGYPTLFAPFTAFGTLPDGMFTDVRVTARLVPLNISQASSGMQIGVITGDGPATQQMQLMSGFSAAASASTNKILNAYMGSSSAGTDLYLDGTGAAVPADATLRDVFMHEIRGGRYARALEGVYAGGLPALTAMYRQVEFAFNTKTNTAVDRPSYALNLPQWSALGVNFFVGTSSAANWTSAGGYMTHLKIEVR